MSLLDHEEAQETTAREAYNVTEHTSRPARDSDSNEDSTELRQRKNSYHVTFAFAFL